MVHERPTRRNAGWKKIFYHAACYISDGPQITDTTTSLPTLEDAVEGFELLGTDWPKVAARMRGLPPPEGCVTPGSRLWSLE